MSFTKKNHMRTVLSILLLVAYFQSYSIQAQGFEVSPVILNFDAEPGGTATKTLTISNYFNKRRAFTLSLKDFTRDETGAKKYFEAGQYKSSCADWITISPSFIEVDPNESKEVSVTITVPSGDKSTRWTMIHVRATSEQTAFSADKGMAGGLKISPTIGVHVYQSPGSNTNFSATVNNFKEITKSGDKQRTLSVDVTNNGDKNIDARMYLLIANNETAEEIKASPTRFPLFPGASRVAKFKLPDDLAPGEYSVAAILDYGHGTDLEGIQMNLKIQ